MNFGSLSFRSPRTGLRKTATRSELDVSGARSPTKILYSFGYCCETDIAVRAEGIEDTGEGTEEAQLRMKGLLELGIVTGEVLAVLLIWARTEAAWAGVGKVRKQ
jgi:hypothetical protein